MDSLRKVRICWLAHKIKRNIKNISHIEFTHSKFTLQNLKIQEDSSKKKKKSVETI